MMPEIALFQALRDVAVLELPPGIPHSGKKFEDYTFQKLYQAVHLLGERSVFPPRYTLREPTYSTVHHQFDIVVREGQLTAIECKFRQGTGINDLFAFLGKLVDYRVRPRGVFVTTARNVGDQVFCYAIAHHISIVCPCLAPVEYMIQQVKAETDLFHRLVSLRTCLCSNSIPKNALVQWQNEHRRFLAEGYQ
jgi:hypothetical protein